MGVRFRGGAMAAASSLSGTELRSISPEAVDPNVQPPLSTPWRAARGSWPWFHLRGPRLPLQAPSPAARGERAYALARSRRMKRGARGVLLWSLALYALAALSLNVLMYRWCPDLSASVHRVKWHQLRKGMAKASDRPLVLALGSSRMDAAFQAGSLDGAPLADGGRLAAYNFGIPAAGPLHEYQYLRDMLDEGIRPSLLVVEVLPPLFSAPHSHLVSEEDWGVPDWMSLHQFRRMRPYFMRPDRKLGDWVAARLAPTFAYRRSLQGVMELRMLPPEERRPVPYTHDRWGCRCPDNLTPKQQATCVRMARDYIPSLNHFRMGDGPRRALRDLLGCCRRKNIKVVLVLMPESTEFRSWYRPECLTAMTDMLTRMQTDWDVPLIDAREWLADDDFTDGHHPAESGARLFTARLLSELPRVVR
jgi:hypothetical protein